MGLEINKVDGIVFDVPPKNVQIVAVVEVIHRPESIEVEVRESRVQLTFVAANVLSVISVNLRSLTAAQPAPDHRQRDL